MELRLFFFMYNSIFGTFIAEERTFVEFQFNATSWVLL